MNNDICFGSENQKPACLENDNKKSLNIQIVTCEKCLEVTVENWKGIVAKHTMTLRRIADRLQYVQTKNEV